MQRLFEFKNNNKHLLFTFSFLLLSLISITQLYILEDTNLSFLYIPFLINFFGVSSVFFIAWLVFITIIFFYYPVSINNKRSLFFIGENDKKLLLSSRNVNNSSVKNIDDISTYDIVKSDNLILTENSLDKLKSILN